MLSLEFDHSCRYDYIEVRDGDSLNSRVIGRYCGNDIPSPIRSSGESLHIRFVSDGYNNYDGFSATFQELTACSSLPCMNGGICSLDPIKTFRCACRAGFTGVRCENNPSGCVTPQKPAHGDLFLQYDDDGIATSVQYLCYKPYKLKGISRRTCLPIGTWSGTAPTCIKVCGKLTSQPQALAETRWPWHVAIYHHLPDHDSLLTGRTKRRGDTFPLVDYDDSQENVSEEQSWQLVCSGALVSQQAVLLPAHCVTEPGQSLSLSTAELRVVLGKHYLSDLRDSKRLQHMQVLEILVHPNYDPNVFESDVAILKLVDKAKISEFISPVCLPRMQGGEVTAKQAHITGWFIAGQHEPTSETDVTVAQTGQVELADVTQCERQYAQEGIPISISDNMMCGRQHPNSPVTVCPSRTGGIVLLPTDTRTTSGPMPPDQRNVEDSASDSSWELLGLVSFGYNLQNCNPGLYTVYTRVANFKKWIDKNIK
ncbi:hypothetical protein NFI96_002613 [Prochilodus magdalenae]|nr:hypothetical protein NFI96_002613 [Prochilodus magdalenae]